MTKHLAIPLACLIAAAICGDAREACAAADGGITLAEVAPPPPSSGVDRASIRNVAEGEIKLAGAKVHGRRKVLVSVAVVRADDTPVTCTVDAVLRDAKTGNMIAILEGRARVEGRPSRDIKREVAHAAVRSAVRQIPQALSGK